VAYGGLHPIDSVTTDYPLIGSCLLSQLAILSARHYSSSPCPNHKEPHGKPSRKRLTKEQKAAIEFPPELKELITGMMLSDGSLRIHGKDAYLQIGQKDKEFVYHLSNLFAKIGIVGAPPIECKSIIKPSGNLRISYLLTTFTMPYLTELHSECYRKVEGKNVKVIPSNIDSLLTPIALAYWLSGDGSYCQTTGRITIATNSFSPDEVELLRKILLDKFNLESTRISGGIKGKDQYKIRTP